MKITKERLKTIIKEELDAVVAGADLEETTEAVTEMGDDKDMIDQMMQQWMEANPNATPQETMDAYYELMHSMRQKASMGM